MRKLRNASIIMLLISALIGTVRGWRMAGYPHNKVIFPYSEEAIRLSVFSNYNLFGWVVFFLLGVFSIIALLAAVFRSRYYSYLMIVEGIFGSFFTITHIVFNGFFLIHFPSLLFCIGMIALGIIQTPREF